MLLLRFLIYKKVTRYFSVNYNWKGLVTDGLLMAMFLFYGVALAMLYNLSVAHHPTDPATPLNLLKGMACSLLIAPVLLRLFPGFALKTTFISPYYPQRKLLIATLDLFAMGLWKTRNAIYLLFLLFFYAFSKGLPPGTGTTLILLLAIGMITGESLVNALSWRTYLHTIILAAFFIVLLWGIRHYFGLDPGYTDSWLAAILLLLAILYFYFYDPGSPEERMSPAKTNRRTPADGSGTRRPSLLVLTGNRSFLTVFAVGMAFKLLILAAFIFSKGYSLNEVIDKAPFIICLITPIILFSYIYNNLWGYFYPIAINSLLSGSDTRRQIKIYLNFLLPALLLDLTITFITLLLRHMLEIKIILAYLATTALCIPIGIISSFKKYFFVPEGLDFNRIRGKTSKLFSFILIVPAMLLGLFYNGNLLFVSTLILITISAIALSVYIYHNNKSLLNKLKLDFFN